MSLNYTVSYFLAHSDICRHTVDVTMVFNVLTLFDGTISYGNEKQLIDAMCDWLSVVEQRE